MHKDASVTLYAATMAPSMRNFGCLNRRCDKPKSKSAKISNDNSNHSLIKGGPYYHPSLYLTSCIV